MLKPSELTAQETVEAVSVVDPSEKTESLRSVNAESLRASRLREDSVAAPGQQNSGKSSDRSPLTDLCPSHTTCTSKDKGEGGGGGQHTQCDHLCPSCWSGVATPPGPPIQEDR